jgi:4-amino-4-deoxy-L-arabinose transferase-like glycosyltransferase
MIRSVETHTSLPSRRDAWPVVALALLSIPIIFYRLGGYSVVNGDEAIYHRVALNMVETGNWFHLEFVGQHRVYDTFMNAPLQYWARAVLISLFGDNYWTMRILSALFGLGSVIATYGLVAYLFNRWAAFLSGLVQLTTMQFAYLHSARTGELEPMICFVLTLALFLLLRAIVEQRSFVPHFVCLAVLMNLKLPLVIVPFVAGLVVLAATPEARSRIPGWIRTGVFVLPLGLVWHAGQFLALGGEAFDTMAKVGVGDLDKERFQSDYWRNLVFYLRTLFLGGFPYSTLYPLAAVAALRWAGGLRQRIGVRLILAYPAALLAFFVFVGRHYEWYIVPIYPCACALVGIFLDRLRHAWFGPWTAAAAALPLAVLAWVRVDVEGFNPFAGRATAMEPDFSMRALGGVPPAAGLLISAAAISLLLFAARAFLRRHAGSVAALLLALLLAVGLHRTLYPLTFIPYVSEMERVRDQLAAARAAGEDLVYPIRIQEKGHLRARYYFGDDFVVRRARQRDDAYFLLYPKPD